MKTLQTFIGGVPAALGMLPCEGDFCDWPNFRRKHRNGAYGFVAPVVDGVDIVGGPNTLPIQSKTLEQSPASRLDILIVLHRIGWNLPETPASEETIRLLARRIKEGNYNDNLTNDQNLDTRSPGRAHREGISIIKLMEMFPTEEAATDWFKAQVWPTGRCCGKCGSTNTSEVPNAKPMPYWCSDCRCYFSVRTGTAIASSKIPLRKWAIAIYLCLTSLKSVSSMKLHRDLDISQKSAWFMLHRLREAWVPTGNDQFAGPVEVDETYMGGKRANMSKAKRKTLEGRGPVGKVAVAGAKDRETNRVSAAVVENTDAKTLQGFVAERTLKSATVYTDDHASYHGLSRAHESVKHSVGEYVRDMAHTNGIESFWAMLKRAHKGTFHKLSPKHLQRYVNEFAGKHNVREMDTAAQMTTVAAGLIGKRLMYRDLIAYNGLNSGARS